MAQITRNRSLAVAIMLAFTLVIGFCATSAQAAVIVPITMVSLTPGDGKLTLTVSVAGGTYYYLYDTKKLMDFPPNDTSVDINKLTSFIMTTDIQATNGTTYWVYVFTLGDHVGNPEEDHYDITGFASFTATPSGVTPPQPPINPPTPVTPSSPSSSDAALPPVAPNYQKGRIVRCSEWVNVRGTSSTDGTIIGKAFLGEAIELLEWNQGGTWCKVLYNGGNNAGWIFGKFIKCE